MQAAPLAEQTGSPTGTVGHADGRSDQQTVLTDTASIIS